MRYEEYNQGYGRVGRRMQRVGRALRWQVKTATGAPRRILVDTRWRLGDEIMAMPVFESLRSRYPADVIAVVSRFPELYENHPFIDVLNDHSFVFDRYILLRGAPRTIRRIEVYAALARVPVPVSRPHLYYETWDTPVVATLPAGGGPLIAIAPGTTWPTKRWPRERWLDLCSHLERCGCRVVELGSGHAPLGACLSLVDRTSIREAACVLHKADLLISCDSGLMHLALAAGSRVVALFGPTDPAILIRDEPNFHPIQSQQGCRGYWNRPGPEPGTDVCPLGHTCCLEDITADAVLEAVARRVTLK